MKCSSAQTGCLQAAKFNKAKSRIEKRPQRGDRAEAVSYRQSAESEPPRPGGVAVWSPGLGARRKPSRPIPVSWGQFWGRIRTRGQRRALALSTGLDRQPDLKYKLAGTQTRSQRRSARRMNSLHPPARRLDFVLGRGQNGMIQINAVA